MCSLYVMMYQYMVSSLVFKASVSFYSIHFILCLKWNFFMQCENIRCRAWRHVSCVIIPEKRREAGSPLALPEKFYCEFCRLSRADP